MLGRPRAAERALGRALRLLDDDVSEAAATAATATRITHAYATLALDGRDAALAELDRARAEAAHLGSPRLAALCDIQEGAVRIWCGEWADAASALERVPLDRALLTDAELATTLLNRGLAHTSLLDLPRARRALSRAVEVATRSDLPIQRFKALHNIGCLEWMAGDLPAAVALMEEADRMPVSVGRARARLDRARVLADAGLIDRAEEALRTALEASVSARLAIDRGDVHLDLALCALARDDLAEARDQARRAARAFTSRQARSRRDEALLVRALVDVRGGVRLGAVARLLEQFAGDERPVGRVPRLAARLTTEVALAQGDLPRARQALDRLAHGPRQPVGVVLHERALRARTLVGEGRTPQARRVLRDAADLLARHQSSATSLDVRAALALHGRAIRDLDVGLSLRTGRPAEVFDAVERWRAASQRARLAVPDPDAEVTTLIARLRRTRYLIDLGEVPDGHPLREEEASLHRLVADRTWARKGAGGNRQATSAVTSAEVAGRPAGDPGQVVLSFFTHGEQMHVVRLGQGEQRLLDLGPSARVAELASTLAADQRARATAPDGHPLAAVVESAWTDSLTRMAGVLRLEDLVGVATRVVVIPAPSTASLPWGALPGLRGLPVTVVPSATRWLRVGERPASAGDLVALAGPGLPRAPGEVAAVRAVWAGALPGSDGAGLLGTAREVVDGVRNARVLHLAAHGRHEHQSPLFSSLRMADGPVFAHELPAPLLVDHAVLSACDVGRSRVRAGDEPLGLTAALLGLGARSVVAAVSPVRDAVASEAMVAYHRLLAGGADAATALAAVIAEHPGAEAFCLYGADWSAPRSPVR